MNKILESDIFNNLKTKYEFYGEWGKKPINAVSTDSRTVFMDNLFIPITGANFDAHQFIPQCIQNGCRCFVVSKGNEHYFDKFDNISFAVCNDTSEFYRTLAGWYRKTLKTKIIAITGTCGKTTVKDFTGSILSHIGKTHKTAENLNNLIGVPLTILSIDDSHSFGVIETGASEKGEIEKSSKIICPDISIITSIGEGHLDGFKDCQSVLKEKWNLALNTIEKVIVNGNDPMLIKKADNNFVYPVFFNKDVSESPFTVSPISADDKGRFSFKLLWKGKLEIIKLNIPGLHSVLNAGISAYCGLLCGANLIQIKNGVESVYPEKMRMQEKKWNKREIILDCYNANPLSMKAGADAFYNMKAEKKYFLYGEMRELGFNSKELHEDCAKYISSKNFDGVFLFGKYAKDLIEFFPKGMVKGISENSHEEMADILIKNTRNGDKIYIKGSRGIRLEYIFEEN